MEKALERERMLHRHALPDPAPIPPLRRFLMSSMFYLPLAGLLGALISWMILEPSFHDFSMVGGEVVLVDSAPFDLPLSGAIVLTLGAREVVVLPGETRMESGRRDQLPFASVRDIQPGAFLEASGERIDANRIVAFGLRPATPEDALSTGQDFEAEFPLAALCIFPLTAVLVALGLLVAEGIASRNWLRLVDRAFLATLLTVVFSFLAYIPAGLAMQAAQMVLEPEGVELVTSASAPATTFILFSACRSVAWACIGAGLGLGMNLVRSTKVQLRNSIIGGALGGAIGGLFFDSIGRFFGSDSMFQGAEASRLVGLMAVGFSVGVFVALVDRLAREAWIVVRSGPLAGKSFVLYKTPTRLGSSPDNDIYLFKDSGIDAHHAAIHRVGNRFEIEHSGGKGETIVEGRAMDRRRLSAGDQIRLGDTVLDFEERSKKPRARKERSS